MSGDIRTDNKPNVAVRVAKGVAAVAAGFLALTACGSHTAAESVPAHNQQTQSKPKATGTPAQDSFNFQANLCAAYANEKSASKAKLADTVGKLLGLDTKHTGCIHRDGVQPLHNEALPALNNSYNGATSVTQWMGAADMIRPDGTLPNQVIVQVTNINTNSAAQNAQNNPLKLNLVRAPGTDSANLHCGLDTSPNPATGNPVGYCEVFDPKGNPEALVAVSLPAHYFEQDQASIDKGTSANEIRSYDAAVVAATAALAVGAASGA